MALTPAEASVIRLAAGKFDFEKALSSSGTIPSQEKHPSIPLFRSPLNIVPVTTFMLYVFIPTTHLSLLCLHTYPSLSYPSPRISMSAIFHIPYHLFSHYISASFIPITSFMSIPISLTHLLMTTMHVRHYVTYSNDGEI